MTAGPNLPRSIRWILERLLPERRREDVIGDVAEAYAERVRTVGSRHAWRWLARQVASFLIWRGSGTLRWGARHIGSRRARAAGAHGAAGVSDGGADISAAPRRENEAKSIARDVWLDVRFAVRTLVRQPGFGLLAIAILGLGIGAPTTVFTLVNRIFLQRPTGVEQPHRLIRVFRSWAPGQGGGSLGFPDYEYYRDNASTLAGLMAYDADGVVAAYDAPGGSDQTRVWFVTANYFEVLGVRPFLGRFFVREENQTPGTHPVAILGHEFWRRAFGGDPEAVGRSLTLNGHSFRVVGVAPRSFHGVSPVEGETDLWVPILMRGTLEPTDDTAWRERLPHARANWLDVVGRLAPGVPFEAARADLENLSAELRYAGRPDGEGVLVSRQYLYRPSLQESLTSLSRMLLAVVAIVLAVATANVAVLLLARASTRSREIGIRSAVGAGRARIVRQLLAESLVLGFAGGAVGLALAYGGADLAGSLLPVPFLGSFAPDLRVLTLAAGLSLATALLVGLVPALHGSKADVAAAIQDSPLQATRGRLRHGLVVGQVGLSVVLVSGAILFARSFWTARSQELGFQTGRRLVVQVDLANHGYEPEEGRAFIARALERIAGTPGVVRVTASRQIPFRGDWTTSFDAPSDAIASAPDGTVETGINVVGADYFATLGIPLVRGRGLTPADRVGSPPVVVVNERFATMLWPGQDPIGRTLPLRSGLDFTVVGVARNALYYELGEAPYPQVYGSVFQVYMPRIHFVVETSGPGLETLPAVKAALREIDPTVVLGWVSTLEAVLDDQVARYQVSAVLVGLFGLIALLLAGTGLYGVVSFLVSRRTREIGVRIALGANPGRVARDVMVFGLRLAVTGVVLGLAGAWGLSGLTVSLLYGVEPSDPGVFLAAAAVLCVVTAAAAFGPARRAIRVDPMEAIRTD